NFPTLEAASTLLVCLTSNSLSFVDALTRVNPFTSSISCAYICLFERNTLRRGRSWVPVNFFRTRACLCLREKFLPGFVIISVTPFCFRSYYLAVLPSFRRTYRSEEHTSELQSRFDL